LILKRAVSLMLFDFAIHHTASISKICSEN